MHRPPAPFLFAAAAALVALPALASSAVAGTPADPEEAPVFTRIDVGTVTGASFSASGEVFDGEEDIVVSGYGALVGGGPSGGGTLDIFRPGKDLRTWTRVSVVKASDGIIFPNQVTLTDMDGDGDTDLLLPSGYFFDTDPGTLAAPKTPKLRAAITWWENKGETPAGAAIPFVRHDVITGQPGSYHGVKHVDLDGDEIKDLVTTSEEAKTAPELNDDVVALEVFLGTGDDENGKPQFAAPITIGDQGGSVPVVADVDEDGDMDIISSQYFGTGSAADHPTEASFLWWEQTGDSGDTPGIEPGDFTFHPIATIGETGPGFAIRPVPDFRGDGKLAWIGTNHTGRCTFSTPQAQEAVFEFTPGEDITDPWDRTTLSNPATPDTSCPAEFKADRNMIFPGDSITSRAVPGQAAPGVFSYGDVDGDGDIDITVAGDGDHRLFWIEQKGDGSTLLHTLTAPGEKFGQSGGGMVADYDGDGTDELVFSSFDKSTVALWTQNAPPVTPPVTPTPKPTTTVISGFKGGKVTTRKKSLVFAATVKPAAGRAAQLQRETCTVKTKKKPKTCSWKVAKTLTTGTTGQIRFTTKVPKGTSRWKITVSATKTSTAATSPVRKVVRR